LTEVVFFGRLETRKGLELFCDALDLVAEGPDTPDFRLCFMGSETPIQGVPARDYLRERSRRWPWRSCIDTERDQPEAVSYIREPGRLAVMPSPVDNSPNTVMEALGLGIPFITSRGGGIPELIHPLDLGRATFAPTDDRLRRVNPADPNGFVAGLSAEPLAAAIRRALSDGRAIPPRSAVDPQANERAHVQWHERVAAARGRPAADPSESPDRMSVSICLEAGGEPHLLERARRSLERQDLAEIERVVAVADTPDDAELAGVATRLHDGGWHVVRAREDELDAAAAAAATGGWLFLCDSEAEAHPALLSTLVRAAQRTGAEVVTVAARYSTAREAPGAWCGNIPLGGAAAVGLHYNCFGLGGALVARDAFERLDGFELDGPPAVRRRDLLCRAALAGLPFEVVPEPLMDYDLDAADRRSLPPMETMLRALRPYQRALPEEVAELPGLALAPSLPATPRDPDEHEVYVRDLEERLHRIVSSRSWRGTAGLRAVMEHIRRLS
jgi:hypothetical protein